LVNHSEALEHPPVFSGWSKKTASCVNGLNRRRTREFGRWHLEKTS
jgi:hypothetical protein